MKSYAQLEQDLLVFKYFQYEPPKHKVFVEVGAFDGISYSNTRLFFEHGWAGAFVEPVMKNFIKLQANYKGTDIKTIHSAATNFDGQMELNVATIPGAEAWGSDVSSLTENTMERFPDYSWGKEMVPAATLNTLFRENSITELDYLSIDVEGHELKVLQGLDLDKYQPAIIVVEYSSEQEKKELRKYLEGFGYYCWLDNQQDLFMVRGKKYSNWRLVLVALMYSVNQKFRK